jgi:oxygen-dependent protoporphyrinogen oxidase
VRRVAVIGGGLAGLSAALRLHDQHPEIQITVYERSHRIGGKLATGELGGHLIETGAEAFLAREADDPSGAPSAAVRLVHRVGLGESLIHPATTSAALLLDGAFRPMPAGTVMGVPTDLAALRAALAISSDPTAPGGSGPPESDRDLGRPVLGADEDVAVGRLVRDRLGDAVVDRLVDPLLGGVYAGRADGLSLATTMPGLAAACRVEHTLQGAARHALSRRSPVPGPVFATVDGGLSRLVDAMAAAMPAVRIERGAPIRELAPAGRGWRLTRGSTRDPELIDVDAVVVAVPSAPATRLLAPIVPAPPATPYASLALVTFVLPKGALDGGGLDGRSGALIPAIEGRLVKAVTVFTTKWGRDDGADLLLRASVGRYGGEADIQLDDAGLTAAVQRDLEGLLNFAPTSSAVTRWGGALPQYEPGHLSRVGRLRGELPGTIALAGAAFDGVGLPACVRSGENAADRLIGALA